MIRQLAAVSATALLATAFYAVQPAVAAPAACTKTVLPLPTGTLPGPALVRSADSTGRYLIGHASREEGSQAVLWVDGVPRWLASKPNSVSRAYSVTDKGFVLGNTSDATSTDYWIYSVATGTYQVLDLPEGFQVYDLTGMNERHDIAGVAGDPFGTERFPFVIPAGGQPKLLPTPQGVDAFTVDAIGDDGSLVGRFTNPDNSVIRSYRWTSWNRRPVLLTGQNRDHTWASVIDGTRIGGGSQGGGETRGRIWNTRTGRYTELEDAITDLNSSGDAVTQGGDDFIDTFPSVLITSTGARTTFPESTHLTQVFDRGNQLSTAGYELTDGEYRAITYQC
ncbi:hypothetical protein OG474_31900 [Kribbella sp. NBC_01505]|uniref:hypothetical protein n=1 Tax=Kribbella sp. NBC_01505 TaxID=2903580 RepID=UPI00386EA55C